MYGRSAQQAALLVLLADRENRVVTVTGRGGVGKTRLALEVAATLEHNGDRQIVVVPLAGLTRASLVIPHLAAAFDLRPLPNTDIGDLLAARLQDEDILVLLDNFEHVLDATDDIVDLLARCAQVQLLVTSQTPLRLARERVMALEPLPTPKPDESEVEVLAKTPAVKTYCQQAVAVDVRFRLHEGNAGAVAELCRTLEGLPLAIELAAARAVTLPAADIVRLLDRDPLGVLRRERGDVAPRHHGLRAAIDWTYQLLDPPEQRLLRRLSLVAGPFDLDTATGLADPVPLHDTIDHLATLVDLHLVDPIPGSDPARFQIPSSIQAFGVEQLTAENDYETARRAHVTYRARQALAIAVGLDTAEEGIWFERVKADQDDLTAALQHAIDTDMVHEATDLVTGLAPLWDTQGYHAAYEELIETALALGEGLDEPPARLADALLWSALLGYRHRSALSQDELVDRLRRGEALARSHGDDTAVLRSLASWMLSTPYTLDVGRAEAATEEGLALASRLGEERWVGIMTAWSGMLASLQGDVERSVELGLDALRLARRNGDRHTTLLATMLLMPLRRSHPELASEIPSAEEALAMARPTGQGLYEALLLAMLIGETAAADDTEGALRWAKQSLAVARAMPTSPVAGYNLMSMMSLASLLGDHDRAAYFHGTVRDSLPHLTRTMASQQIEAYDRAMERSREALGEPRFEDVAQRGARVTWADGLAAALDYVKEREPIDQEVEEPVEQPAELDRASTLTPRQREVLALLAKGLRNKEIATELGVTPKTVMHHTTAVYGALGVRSRSEAVAWALRTGFST
jgi:predicted ATPase/DNA-binding CsgD family transcriptional regulator